jgi:hypothetical protein
MIDDPSCFAGRLISRSAAGPDERRRSLQTFDGDREALHARRVQNEGLRVLGRFDQVVSEVNQLP